MIYLASPYSHKSLGVRNNRYLAVCKAAAELMARGEIVFSPIAHSHGIALCGELPMDWKYWKPACIAQMKSCDRFMVLMLKGWEYSFGIKEESRIALGLGMWMSKRTPGYFGIEE